MSDFGPLRELLPLVRPRASDELVEQWIARYYAPRHTEQSARLWRNHFASVADYWHHKQRHPDRSAGVMMILYRWTPYILGTTSILTVNPTILLPGLLSERRKKITVDDFIRLAQRYRFKA